MHAYADSHVRIGWARVAVAEPLVRSAVVELTGRDPGPLHHTCPFCGSVEHGQPYVAAPVHVSVAHARGITLVAASDLGPVGVDVERGDDFPWVRREAIGKARGVGLVTAADDPPIPVVVHEARIEIPGHAAVVVVLSGTGSAEAPSGTTTHRTAR